MSGPGGVVELFDAADQSLGSLAFSGAPVPGFAFREGFVGVSSDTPFLRAAVTWTTPTINARFAFDNLRYEAPVPQPATFALLGLGLAGMAAARRRRS